MRQIYPLVGLSLALAALSGCEAAPAPSAAPAAELTQAQSPALAAWVEQERWQKSQRAAPTQVDAALDWAAARRDLKPLALPDALRASLDKVPMPVLLPARGTLAQSAFLTQGQGWHALAMEGDGLHVSLHAWSRAVERPDLRDELGHEALKTPRVSESHAIWSVSFERYGASYLLDLECEAPGTDPRCANGEAALDLYKDLVVAGGQP